MVELIIGVLGETAEERQQVPQSVAVDWRQQGHQQAQGRHPPVHVIQRCGQTVQYI